MNKTKNDLAWESLFNKYNIPEMVYKVGHFEISATQINEFREARLMTKFDHKSQLPELFIENSLSILPISRGGYVIGNFNTFHDFNADDVEVSTIKFPEFLESLDFKNISSEATALNCAYVSKIIHDFTGEQDLWPTVSGRMSSSSFNFNINSEKGTTLVKVANSQVEIDSGYEGVNSLFLLEAKNYISSDFLVRQLFYPYKLWNTKIHKQVRPIFFTYTNGIFHLREYNFTNPDHYNSLILIKQKKYQIQKARFDETALMQLIANTKLVKEPKVPFPQADNFERVINLCELLNQKEFMSKEEITVNYDFDPRQTDYYVNAGKYLGLIETGRDSITGINGCWLSSKGKQVFDLDLSKRQKEFLRLVISHSIFRESLFVYLEKRVKPDKHKISEIMKRSNLYKINSNSTYSRRASTISGWISWIVNQIQN